MRILATGRLSKMTCVISRRLHALEPVGQLLKRVLYWSPFTVLAGSSSQPIAIGSRELYETYRASVAYQHTLPLMVFVVFLDFAVTVNGFLQFVGITEWFPTAANPYIELLRTVASLILVLLAKYLSKYCKKAWLLIAFLSVCLFPGYFTFHLNLWTVFPPCLLMLLLATIYLQQSFLMSLVAYIATLMIVVQVVYPVQEIKTVQMVSRACVHICLHYFYVLFP